jgi:hypothetical protein
VGVSHFCAIFCSGVKSNLKNVNFNSFSIHSHSPNSFFFTMVGVKRQEKTTKERVQSLARSWIKSVGATTPDALIVHLSNLPKVKSSVPRYHWNREVRNLFAYRAGQGKRKICNIEYRWVSDEIGVGVFATRPIAEKTKISASGYLGKSVSFHSQQIHSHSSIVQVHKRKHAVAHRVLTGGLAFTNYACEAHSNCIPYDTASSAKCRSMWLRLTATEDIPKGNEITCYYGSGIDYPCRMCSELK